MARMGHNLGRGELNKCENTKVGKLLIFRGRINDYVLIVGKGLYGEDEESGLRVNL